MGFKSYCWSIGTTSFRVEQLNYINECQLRYLNELFTSNPDMKWDKSLQTKYFDLLVSKDFIEDYNEIQIRPFVALLYMLSKLEYLTREEFPYLYPTCMNNNDVLKTTADILSARGKITVDNLLIKRMMSMDNYQEAHNLLMTSDVIDESVMEQIGMNRTSGKYDRPFAKVYNVLKTLVIKCQFQLYTFNAPPIKLNFFTE